MKNHRDSLTRTMVSLQALSKTQLDSLWAEMNAADSVRRVDHIASALRTSDSASFSSMGSKRGRILIPGAGRYIIDADGLACASNSTRRAVRSSDVYAPFQSKPASASGAGPLFHSHPHSSPALRLSSVTLGGLLSGRKRPRPGSNGAVRGGGEAAAAPVADAPASRDALFDPMLCSILLRGTATASSLSVPLSISSTEASSALHSNGGCLSAAPPPSSSSSSVVSSSSSTGSSSIYFSDGDPAPSLSSNGTDAAPDARSTAKAALLAVAAAAKARAAGSKLAITQTVKFAGQTMRVTKLVEAGTAAAKAATADAEAARARAAIAGPGTDFAPTSTLSRATVMAASSSSSVAPSSSSLSSSSALSSQGGVLTEQHQLAASTTTRQEGQLSSTVVHPQSISTFADAHPPQPSLHGAAASAAAAAAGSISLDAIISNLDKPEAISTLTKSSLDWDTYKHSHGLGDELERCVRVVDVGLYCDCSGWPLFFAHFYGCIHAPREGRRTHIVAPHTPFTTVQRHQGWFRGEAGLPLACG